MVRHVHFLATQLSAGNDFQRMFRSYLYTVNTTRETFEIGQKTLASILQSLC